MVSFTITFYTDDHWESFSTFQNLMSHVKMYIFAHTIGLEPVTLMGLFKIVS